MTATPISRPKILLLDSGVGGLTVMTDIKQVLPEAQYLYLMDNDFAPYGLLSEVELGARLVSVLRRILSEQPDIVVIACNTASTMILPAIRALTNIPVVGVIPPIKPAAAMTKTNVIGLLATPGTIGRQYTDQLITDFAHHCQVIKHGSSRLVAIAEAKLRREPISNDEIKEELDALFKINPNIDVVVLGCTHFPHLKSEFQQVSKTSVFWLDSGAAIARRVLDLTKSIPAPPSSINWPTSLRIFYTRHDDQLKALKNALTVPNFIVFSHLSFT